MGYLIALFAFLARLFRPSQGVHASPYGYARELYAETTRSPRRTRVMHAEGEPSPRIPAPRKPVDDELPHTLRPVPTDYVPIVNPRAVQPQAAMVRPAYRRWEESQARTQELARIDRDRLALAVLMELSRAAHGSEVGR